MINLEQKAFSSGYADKQLRNCIGLILASASSRSLSKKAFDSIKRENLRTFQEKILW